jgi:hypothetical protein
VKREGEWCRHCDVGGGCRIYLDRTEQCRQFSCLWLQGGWEDEDDRPDRLKVVVSDMVVPVRNRHIRIVQFIETEPGAIDQARVATLIATFRAKGLAICIARLDPVGRYADASYEIPVSQLTKSDLDLFQQELSRLNPFAS